jgi:lipopolysaccharide heptosyltransferase II
VTSRKVAIPTGGFRRIAVLRLSSLGDVVLTLPVVHALRAAWPAAEIAYWVKEEFQDAVRHDPALTRIRALDRDARRIEDVVSMSAELEDCDLIVDLHGSARSRLLTFQQKAPVVRAPSYRLLRERWVRARWTRPRPAPHAVERYAQALRPLGVVPAGPPRMTVDAVSEGWAAAWLAEWALDAPVALCPGARHFTKRWPEERWRGLLRSLAESGRAVVVLSLPRERDALPGLAADVTAAARARWCVEPLPRMAAVLSRCATTVTSDSGLMHVAAARGQRVVALFGSTAPELGFAPVGEGHAVLCRHEPCQPCTLHGRPSCPKGHFRCMLGITVEEVRAALDSRSA